MHPFEITSPQTERLPEKRPNWQYLRVITDVIGFFRFGGIVTGVRDWDTSKLANPMRENIKVGGSSRLVVFTSLNVRG